MDISATIVGKINPLNQGFWVNLNSVIFLETYGLIVLEKKISLFCSKNKSKKFMILIKPILKNTIILWEQNSSICSK